MLPTLKERLLKGSAWVLLGKFTTAGSTLLINALLTRLLGPEGFGLYTLAFSLVWFCSTLAQLGLNNAVVRLVAESIGLERPGRARASIGAAYRYAAVGIAVVAGFLFVAGAPVVALGIWNKPLLAAVMGAVAGWVTVHSLQILTSESFRGFQDLRLATLFGGVVTGLLLVLVLGLSVILGRETSLQEVILWHVVAAGISLLIALIVLQRKVSALPPREPLAAAQVFGISIPLWVNGMMAFGLQQSDILIVGAYRSSEELGYYGAAFRLVNLVSMSLVLVNLIVPPVIAELYARGEKRRLERLLRNAATIAGLPALAALVPFVFVGSPILDLVYGGAEFRAGAAVLAILSLGKVVHVWTGSSSMVLSMTGHQSALMRITIVTTILTIGGSLALVRPFGGVGVAWAITGGVSLQSLWVWLTAKRKTGIWAHCGVPHREDLRTLFRSLRGSED